MKRLFALLLLAPLAAGSYIQPVHKDRHFVAVKTWTLKKGKKSYTLAIEHRKKKLTYKVDLFWLADRVNSNSICLGGHIQEMSRYLDALALRAIKPELLVELCNTKKKPKLFVAGVWAYDDALFHRVKGGGSPKLLPYKEAVKLPDRKALDKVIAKASAAGWKAIAPAK